MYSILSHGTVIKMTMDQAKQAAHQGDCEKDCRELMEMPFIKNQFKKFDPEMVKKELKEYGAWNEAELSDTEMNNIRLLWLAAGDITEQPRKIFRVKKGKK